MSVTSRVLVRLLCMAGEKNEYSSGTVRDSHPIPFLIAQHSAPHHKVCNTEANRLSVQKYKSFVTLIAKDLFFASIIRVSSIVFHF